LLLLDYFGSIRLELMLIKIIRRGSDSTGVARDCSYKPAGAKFSMSKYYLLGWFLGSASSMDKLFDTVD